MPANEPDNQLCQYAYNINHKLDDDCTNMPIVYPKPTDNNSADTPTIITK